MLPACGQDLFLIPVAVRYRVFWRWCKFTHGQSWILGFMATRPWDSWGTDHGTVHALITWLSCTDHVTAHALMTWLFGH